MSQNKGKAKKESSKPYSGISAHKIEKKVLVPPLMAVPGMTLVSWMNDRMPEMLWAALVIHQLGRERALARFRNVAKLVQPLPEESRSVHPTLSGLASLAPGLLRRFLSAICSDSETKKALRPLLLFDALPARSEWEQIIGQIPSAGDWETVKAAVLHVLDPHSQDATDCRWLRVLFQVLSGTFHLQNEEQVREILEYPHYGLPEAVRPSVRCMEGVLDGLHGTRTSWPGSFWNQCLRNTACDVHHTMEAKWLPHLATTSRRIQDVREALARHEGSSLRTTAVDAKHDAAFGFGAYSLAVLEELLKMGNSTAILGRLGLRTLLECYVTLSYLKTSNDPNLWTAYRQYGSAQAKLAFLKLDDPGESIPTSIDVEILRQLANEDRWLEYVSIDLGHWAAKDLRKMSDGAGVKADYDRLYPWTSAFTHSNWAAVRNSCFDLCINPLHRLHRRLRSDTANLGDVVQDACEIVDKILGLIDSLYPGLTARVTLPQSRAPLRSAPAADAEPGTPTAAQLATIQGEFFQILDEFFRMATGVSAQDFARLDSFGDRIRGESRKLINRGPQAYMYAHEALQAFYKRFALQIFPGAKKLAGLKMVLGGTARFGESQFDCVRKMLLYADSILVPDPVLPWIESARAEERFRSILLLEAAFVLLHLKPFVDTELCSPPIVIFPSFEKTLEERDDTTQTEIGALTTRLLSHLLGHRFESIEELQEFAVANEEEFMGAIDERHLFVAPAGQVGQPLREALEQYGQEIRRWRAGGYQSVAQETPKGLLLLNGLTERIAPQYHLLENAGELLACPLIPLLAPWHYYSLISRFFADRLRASGNLDEEALGSLELVCKPEHKWLGNVPVPELVHLLQNRENLTFRATLRGIVSGLHNAPQHDLSRIASEVRREVMSLLQQHDGEVPSILEKYRPRYGEMGAQQYVTTGVNFMLTLAPTLQSSRGTLPAQPQSGPHAEVSAKSDAAASSLLGVLAAADGS